MAFPFRRAPRPTARAIIDAAIEHRDYDTAALFILAGAADVVADARRQVAATTTGPVDFERTLRAATAQLVAAD